MTQTEINLSVCFKEALTALCPTWAQERFIIAFSGGLDSTALLLLAASVLDKKHLAAAHLNHQLRGDDALRDKNFSQNIAIQLGIEFIDGTCDVNALAAQRRQGLEEAARQARYDFLEKAARQFEASFILTGHHADDQAETILMNLVKGCGSGGLAGMPSKRMLGAASILRPLLNIKRDLLENFLKNKKQSWMDDYSNHDTKYLRNAIRNDIVPRLKDLNPRIDDSLVRMADILRAEEEFWQLHLQELWSRCYVDDNSTNVILKRTNINCLTLAQQRRLIYEALLEVMRRNNKDGEVYFNAVAIILGMLGQARHRGLDLPGGLRAELSKEFLLLSLASRFKNKN